jgi:hypothetical protein
MKIFYNSQFTSRQRLSQGDDSVKVSEDINAVNAVNAVHDEKLRLLALGRQDTTTPVTVTVTIHTTPEFR